MFARSFRAASVLSLQTAVEEVRTTLTSERDRERKRANSSEDALRAAERQVSESLNLLLVYNQPEYPSVFEQACSFARLSQADAAQIQATEAETRATENLRLADEAKQKLTEMQHGGGGGSGDFCIVGLRVVLRWI